MPPVSLKEAEQKTIFAKQVEKPVDKSAVSLDRRSEDESPTLSVTAWMLAVRQLQAPLAGSTSMSASAFGGMTAAMLSSVP
jgi:hypothetical protein